MIRNVMLVLVAALATATAAASTTPVSTGANSATPAGSLSDITVFGGSAAQSQKPHRQYAQAVGDDSKKCKDKDGNVLKDEHGNDRACPAGYVNGDSAAAGASGAAGGEAAGLSAASMVGIAALAVAVVSVAVTTGNGGGRSLSAP